MNSMQDALTEALEHPITEPKARSNPARRTRKTRQRTTGSNPSPDRFFWSVLGSIAGSLLAYGVYRWRNS